MADVLDMGGTEQTPHVGSLMNQAQAERAAREQAYGDRLNSGGAGDSDDYGDVPCNDTPEPLGWHGYPGG